MQVQKENLQLLITQPPEAYLHLLKAHFYKVDTLFIRKAFLNNSGMEKSRFLCTHEFPHYPSQPGPLAARFGQ